MRRSLWHSLQILLTFAAVLSAAIPAYGLRFACGSCSLARVSSLAETTPGVTDHTDCCSSPHAAAGSSELSCVRQDVPAVAGDERSGDGADHAPCSSACPLPCCRVLVPATAMPPLLSDHDGTPQPAAIEPSAPLLPAMEGIFHPPRT